MTGGKVSKEVIAQLQSELAQLQGQARLPGLVRLGQALLAEYHKAPGTPAAKPDLDASILALDEAYGHTQLDDPMRAAVASLLGFTLAARVGAHGGPERDRETAIHVLEEALSFPQLTSVQRCMTLFALGQTYLLKASGYVQAGGFGLPAASSGGRPAQGLADINRAVDCLREIVDGEPVDDKLLAAARTLLEMAEVLRTVLGVASGNLLGADIGRLSDALAKIQGLSERFKHTASGYQVPHMVIPSAQSLLAADPLERPIVVVQGKAAGEAAIPDPRRKENPAPYAPAPAEAERFGRRSNDRMNLENWRGAVRGGDYRGLR
jgi:hypothetical protein